MFVVVPTGQFSVVLMIHNEQAGLSLSSPQLIKKKFAIFEHSSEEVASARFESRPPRPEIKALQMSYSTVDKINTFVRLYNFSM